MDWSRIRGGIRGDEERAAQLERQVHVKARRLSAAATADCS
eukprot:CAMPEP_0183359946 /NCGR_PEP_ID=MMETSP0164_2-20130417/53785_1 /TAXON_ID=221442 /ORGANISM="Coccolithus pelagicus ssp braarudi, Strain PLY182g" /LENGTH=40 /DNA_ID= /DNA_START= /DNA_END= /DNA_ORIENTATION=